MEKYTVDIRKEYDSKEQKNQYVIKRNLYYLDKICNTHNITYSVGCGTLLGAIRDKDIIPWDLDADVYMEYESFVKFINIANSELPKDIFLQHTTSDIFYNSSYTFARLVDLKSSIEPTSDMRISPNGVHIDIQCVGSRTQIEKLIKKDSLSFSLYKIIVGTILSFFNFFVTYDVKKTILQIGYFGIYLQLATLKEKYTYIFHKGKVFAEKYDIHKLVRIAVDDIQVWGLEEFDDYLRDLYGDYLKKPETNEIEKSLNRIYPEKEYKSNWLIRKLYHDFN